MGLYLGPEAKRKLALRTPQGSLEWAKLSEDLCGQTQADSVNKNRQEAAGLMRHNEASGEERNQSYHEGFILLGVADRPHLEILLFAVILTCYAITLVGNTTIIVVSWLDPHLHTPMYFFLSNLSFLDLCFTTSLGPQMLVNFWRKSKSITYASCVTQLYISLALGSTECILLAVMAYDRYAAVCHPLHYITIMSSSICFKMAAVSWICGFSNSLVQTVMTLRLPLCGQNRVDHFFCEVPALLKLACVDTTFNEAVLFAASVVFLLVPLGLIIVSYGFIATAVLRIRSAEGRRKAFNTCASHLMVVSLFYGTAIFSYLQPPSNYSRDRGKMISLFYTYVTTMLNPLIYTLRNKEVRRALKRLLGRTRTAEVTLESGRGTGECEGQVPEVGSDGAGSGPGKCSCAGQGGEEAAAARWQQVWLDGRPWRLWRGRGRSPRDPFPSSR
ncbi:olfactory receptor 2G3-like [Tiliqua scincoides]|uniref:olfactory receptor 2G3-like n=1 Tax=Tiliqua scincoides TaxID=71010 RepID=UPI0034629006